MARLGLGSAGAADDKPAPAPSPAVVSAGAEGFAIQSADGAFKLRVSGYAQGDGRFYASDANGDGVDAFVLRRVRPILSGTVGRSFDFVIMSDFGGGMAVVQDAFLDARFTPAFRLKVGKFKGPVGLERLQSGAALTFVERGLPTDLVPNREVGVQVHGETAGGVLYYQAGVFDGVVDGGSGDADVNDGKDLEGRVFIQPFKKGGSPALKGLGLGIAGTTGTQSGALPTHRSIGQLAFFTYALGVTADGGRTRLAPQVSYQSGALRLFGEWVRVRQELRRSSTDALRASHASWQGVASLVLTGEAPSGGLVTPRKPFDPSRGAWGALEVAARYGELAVDQAVFNSAYADRARSASKARAWGFGLNWHLTRNVKYVASYDHTTFVGGAPAGGNRRAENAVFLRAQVGF